MSTGVFFHYQQGERLRDFPQVLGTLLESPQVFLYDAFYPRKPKSSYDLEAVPEELLLKVHTREMVARVKRSPFMETAFFSAGGTVQAAEKVWRGEVGNAFVFTGVGDHHAGRDFFSGWCYFNGAALAIARLRDDGAGRFAILDTDAHHGDGTWNIFREDESVLYICLCPWDNREHRNKINIHTPNPISDEEYLAILAREALPRIRDFRPQLLFWNWGYDGTQGEYGDMGLSPALHPRLAQAIKAVADEVCGGRLVVVLCGGSSRQVANESIPGIIACLAGISAP